MFSSFLLLTYCPARPIPHQVSWTPPTTLSTKGIHSLQLHPQHIFLRLSTCSSPLSEQRRQKNIPHAAPPLPATLRDCSTGWQVCCTPPALETLGLPNPLPLGHEGDITPTSWASCSSSRTCTTSRRWPIPRALGFGRGQFERRRMVATAQALPPPPEGGAGSSALSSTGRWRW